jgi:plasmid replication initiation protein
LNEKKRKGFEYENIVPIPYVKWTDYHDEVDIDLIKNYALFN